MGESLYDFGVTGAIDPLHSDSDGNLVGFGPSITTPNPGGAALFQLATAVLYQAPTTGIGTLSDGGGIVVAGSPLANTFNQTQQVQQFQQTPGQGGGAAPAQALKKGATDRAEVKGIIFRNKHKEMSEEEFERQKSRFLGYLQELANWDTGVGGALARKALTKSADPLIVVFDSDLVDNAYGKFTGMIQINPRLPDYFPPLLKRDEFNLFFRNGERLPDDEIAKILLVHELGHALAQTLDPIADVRKDRNIPWVETLIWKTSTARTMELNRG